MLDVIIRWRGSWKKVVANKRDRSAEIIALLNRHSLTCILIEKQNKTSGGVTEADISAISRLSDCRAAVAREPGGADRAPRSAQIILASHQQTRRSVNAVAPEGKLDYNKSSTHDPADELSLVRDRRGSATSSVGRRSEDVNGLIRSCDLAEESQAICTRAGI
ncbi:hypothetical protein J6590_052348 [Homalodisca vitripennis]|nr:hypothetical protein J6590_052348 [Homalodisca vitripennis]